MARRVERLLLPALVAAAVASLAGRAPAQLQVAYRDGDIGGTVDVIMEAPAGTSYLNLLSLNEGPTCFGKKHPVGCIDVGLDLVDASMQIPGFFATMGASGSDTEVLDIDSDPAFDGIVVNMQMIDFVSGKITHKSNLCKVVLGWPATWNHSVSPMLGDPGGVPAIPLADGRLAFLGGNGANLDQCEAYEPLRQTFEPLAVLPIGRAGHTVTKLADGRVLVTGGADLNLVALKSAFVYDPSSDAWTQVGDMTSVRAAHSASLLPNGKVLIAGGTTDLTDPVAGALATLKTTETFDPATGKFTAGPSMNRPHGAHTCVTLASGDVLVAGGGSFHKIFGIPIPDLSDKAQVYAVASGTWSSEVTMKAARVGASGIVLASGKALLCGGIGGSLTSPSQLASAETFDPATSKWANVGSMSAARSGMGLVLMPGTNRVVVAGGATGTSVTSPIPTDLVELYDPASATFLAAAPLPETRAGPAAILLSTNQAAFFGGVGTPTAAALYRD